MGCHPNTTSRREPALRTGPRGCIPRKRYARRAVPWCDLPASRRMPAHPGRASWALLTALAVAVTCANVIGEPSPGNTRRSVPTLPALVKATFRPDCWSWSATFCSKMAPCPWGRSSQALTSSRSASRRGVHQVRHPDLSGRSVEPGRDCARSFSTRQDNANRPRG